MTPEDPDEIKAPVLFVTFPPLLIRETVPLGADDESVAELTILPVAETLMFPEALMVDPV